jgi:hypothetical protein
MAMSNYWIAIISWTATVSVMLIAVVVFLLTRIGPGGVGGGTNNDPHRTRPRKGGRAGSALKEPRDV